MLGGIEEENIFVFYEDKKTELAALFPNSNLNLEFDFSCCQGSGLNIYGEFFLLDFWHIWNATREELDTIFYYFPHIKREIWFTQHYRGYSYSLKFEDKKEIPYFIEEAAEDLKFAGIEPKTEILEKFFVELFEHFEALEREYYKNGFSYVVDIEEERIKEYCENYGIEFLEDGTIF